MNEHDAMARLTAANPVPRVEAPPSQALFCLRTVMAEPRPAPTRRRTVPIAAAAAAVVVLAGAVTTVALRPEPAPQPPVALLAEPRAVLAAAADLAAREPAEGRFVHVTGTAGRVVHIDSAGGYDVIRVDAVRALRPADGQPGEGWLTIGEDGASVRPLTATDADAYRRDGSPAAAGLGGDPVLSPDLADDPEFEGPVAELPDDAASALLGGADGPVADPQGWLFRESARLLDTFTSVLGGADRAKVFHTLSAVTGVRTLDTAVDPMGRPAVGLAYTGTTPRHGVIDWQIYLLAGTDRIGFTQAVVREPGPDNRTLAPGTVQYSTAVTAVVHSDTP